MENSSNHHLLEALSTVYDKAKGSQLSSTYFESIQTELTILDQYFNTTNPDTFLLSLFIGHQFYLLLLFQLVKVSQNIIRKKSNPNLL